MKQNFEKSEYSGFSGPEIQKNWIIQIIRKGWQVCYMY